MFSLKDFGVTKEVGKLKNGARVVLFSKPGAPIATIVAFNAGSRFDPVGKEGLAHFTEHMLFQKTEKFKTATELAEHIEKIGGHVNAGTGSDHIEFTADISDKADYSVVVTIINEVFNHMIIDKKMFENERNVILKEIADGKANPRRYVFDLADILFFQESSMGRSGIGSIETVSAIKEEDIKKYYKKMLNTGKMTIVVCGDMKLDELIGEFDKGMEYLGEETTLQPEFGTLPVIRKKMFLSENYKDTENNQIVFGFRTCSMFDEDRYALRMLAYICGSGFTCSLYKKLREENGLVYSVHVYSGMGPDAGAWMVITSTQKENLQKLFDLVCEEFRRIFDGGVSDEELRLAKAKYLKSKKQSMQTAGSWADFHAVGELYNPQKTLNLAEYMNRINKVTLSDLERVGKKYFKRDSWYLAMCGDASEKDFKINY